MLLLTINNIGSVKSRDGDEDEEDDEDEDNDEANIYASLGTYIFLLGQINVLLLHLMRVERKYIRYIRSKRKFPSQEKIPQEKGQEPRPVVKPLYKKTHRILRYIHLVFSLGGLGLIFLHGIAIEERNQLISILGWGLWGMLAFYSLSGMVVWYKLLPRQKIPKLNAVHRWLNKFHRSALVFYVIITLHLFHFGMGD